MNNSIQSLVRINIKGASKVNDGEPGEPGQLPGGVPDDEEALKPAVAG